MNVNRKRTLNGDNESSPEKKPRLALYLEDNTPIRTIEVTNFPMHLNEDNCKSYLHGYFARDGPIEHVEVVTKPGNEIQAFVTFVVPLDAAKLLVNKDVPGYCRHSLFTVKEADQYHQPKIDPNAVTLEQLNDHCLLLVMSRLELIDVVSLGKASTRLQSASRLFYKKHSNFSFGAITSDSSLNETNLPIILEELGSHICSIDWHYLNAVQLDLLTKYCPNVTKVKISSTKKDLTSVALNRNKRFFANLKRLVIDSSKHLYDGGLKTMMSGKKVKTLDLNRCLKIRGKYLTSLNRSKLKHLKVVDCPSTCDIKSLSLGQWKNKLLTFWYDKCCSYSQCLEMPPETLSHLKDIRLDFSCYKGNLQGFNICALTKLQSLTLTRRYQPNAINGNNMIEAFSQLNTIEKLNIQGIKIDNYTIECLQSMPNLKWLRMDESENTIGRSLYETLRVNLSTLEQLSLSFITPEHVTGKLLLDLIVGMPKLNYFSHSAITSELLDVILKTKSPKFFSERSSLNIGVSAIVYTDPKLETLHQLAGRSAITVTVHH